MLERVGLHHQLIVKGCERRCVRDGKCASQTRRVFPEMRAIGMDEVVVRNGRICPSLLLLPFRGHFIFLPFRGHLILLLRVLLSFLCLLLRRFIFLVIRYRLACIDFLSSFEFLLELIGVLMGTIRDKYIKGGTKYAYCLNLQSGLLVFQGWGGSRKNQQRLSTPNSCQIQCWVGVPCRG